MVSLRNKTIQGLQWNFISGLFAQSVTFITGIVLARLLSPYDFGTISIIMVITSFLDLLIDGGFSNALIRKYNCTQNDYSTVFFFNIIIALVLYMLLFCSANFIAAFFNNSHLIMLLRILGLGIFINSLSIIQNTMIQIKMDYIAQSLISILSAIVSGVAGIVLAYNNFGIWSLVWQVLVYKIINLIILSYFCKWLPKLLFDRITFQEMFSFGSRLLIAGFINTLFSNFYYIIIGRFFSAVELGYFGRAEQIANLPSSNLTKVINKVSAPILASIKENPEMLKRSYKKIIRLTMFVTFFIMLTLFACSKSLILTIFTAKWEHSILYLQLLSLTMMLYPLHSLNISMIGISGRSDLVLKLEVWKKITYIPLLAIGFIVSIQLMLILMIFFSFAAYLLNSYYSSKVMNYPPSEQIKDILPSFTICLSASLLSWVTGIILYEYLIDFHILILSIQAFVSIFSTYILATILKNQDMLEIKKIIVDKLAGLNFTNRIIK